MAAVAMRSVPILVGVFLAALPAAAATTYSFAATINGPGTSFGMGAVVTFSGVAIDPALIPGGSAGPVFAVLDGATSLTIAGAPQTGTVASIGLLSSPSNRFELFITFDGGNNPDIAVLADLPGGIEADFPQISFDLADPGVVFVAAEINEDGIEPVPLAVTRFIGVPEPGAATGAFAGLATLAILAWSRSRRRD